MSKRKLSELLFPRKKTTIRMDFRVPFLNKDRRREKAQVAAEPWLWDTLDEVLWSVGDTMDY